MPAQDPGSRPAGNGVRASSMRNRLKPETSLAMSDDDVSTAAPPSAEPAGSTPCQQAEQREEQRQEEMQKATTKEASNGDVRSVTEGTNLGGLAGHLDLTTLPTDPGALLHLLQLGLQCANTKSAQAPPRPDTDTGALVPPPRVRSPSPPAKSPATVALVAAANNLRPPSSSNRSRWEGPGQQAPAGHGPAAAAAVAAGPQYGLAAWAQAVEDAVQAASCSSSVSGGKDAGAGALPAAEAVAVPRNIRSNSLQRRYHGLPVGSSSGSSSFENVRQQPSEQQQEQQQQRQDEELPPPHSSPSLGDLLQQPAAAAGGSSGGEQLATAPRTAAGLMPSAERRRLAVALLTAAGELLQGDATGAPGGGGSSSSSSSNGQCLPGEGQTTTQPSAAQPASSADDGGADVGSPARSATPAGWFACTQQSGQAAVDGSTGGSVGVRYNPWSPGSPAAAALAQQQPEAVQRQALLQLSARMRAAVLSDPRTSTSAMVQVHNGSSETSFITGKKVTGSNIQLMRGSALGTGLEGGVAVSGRLHMDSNVPGNSWSSPSGALGEREASPGRAFEFWADSSSSNISPGPTGDTAATSSRDPAAAAAAVNCNRDSNSSSRGRTVSEGRSRGASRPDNMASSSQWQYTRGRSPGRYSSTANSSSCSANPPHCNGANRIDDILAHLSPSKGASSSGSNTAGRHQRPQQLLRQLHQQQQHQGAVPHGAWPAASCPSPRGRTADSSWNIGRAPGTAAAAAAHGRRGGASPARRAVSAAGSSARGATAGPWGGESFTPGGSSSRTWTLGPRPASAAGGAAGVSRAGVLDMQQRAMASSPPGSGMNISRQAAQRSRSPRRRLGSASPPARSSSPPLGGLMAGAVGGGGSPGTSRQRARSAPAVPRTAAGQGRAGAAAAAGVSGGAATVWDVNRDTLVFNMFNIRGAEEEEEEEEQVTACGGGGRSPTHGTRYASPNPTASAVLYSLGGTSSSTPGGTGRCGTSRSQAARPCTSAAAAGGVQQGLWSSGFTQWGQLEAGRGQQLQLQLSPLQWQDVVPVQRTQQSPGKRYSSGSTGAVKTASPATPAAAGAAAAVAAGVGWFATPPPPRTLAPRWEAAASMSPRHQSTQRLSSSLPGLASASKAQGRSKSPEMGAAGAAEGASPMMRILAMRSPSPEMLTEKWRQQTLHHQQQQQQSVQQVPLAWSTLSPDRSGGAKLHTLGTTGALTSQPWTPGTSLAGPRPMAASGAGGWSLNLTGSSLLATGAAAGSPGKGHTMQRSLAGSPDMLLRSIVAGGSPVPAAAAGELPGVFDLLHPSDQSLHVANLVTRPRSVGGLTVGSLPYNSLLSPSLVSPKHRVTPLASTTGTSPPGTPLLGASRVTPGPTAAAAAGGGGIQRGGAYVRSLSSTSRQAADGPPGDAGDDPGDWDPVGQLLAASPFAAAAHAGMADQSAAAGAQPRTTAAAAAAASMRAPPAAYGLHQPQQATRSGKQVASPPPPPQQQQQRQQKQQHMEQSLMNKLPSPGWAPGASSKHADAAPAGGRLGASSYTTAASAAAAGMHWFEGNAPSTSTLVAARKDAAHQETVQLASTLRATQRSQQPAQQQPLPQQQSVHQRQQQQQQEQLQAYADLLEPTDLDSDSDADRQVLSNQQGHQQVQQQQQPVAPVAPELVTGVPGLWRRSQSGSFEFAEGGFDSWGQLPGSPGGLAAATMPARGGAGAAATWGGKAAATMPSRAGGGGVTSDRHKLASSLSSGKAASSGGKKRTPAGAAAVTSGHGSLRGSGREYM